jgi:hypothetical protein
MDGGRLANVEGVGVSIKLLSANLDIMIFTTLALPAGEIRRPKVESP